MSKSLGNVLEPRALVAIFGLDQIRYFLLREKAIRAPMDRSATRPSSAGSTSNSPMIWATWRSARCHGSAQLRRRAAGAGALVVSRMLAC